MIQKLGADGKDSRIARGLKPVVNTQPEKLLHVSCTEIAVGPVCAKALFHSLAAHAC